MSVSDAARRRVRPTTPWVARCAGAGPAPSAPLGGGFVGAWRPQRGNTRSTSESPLPVCTLRLTPVTGDAFAQ